MVKKIILGLSAFVSLGALIFYFWWQSTIPSYTGIETWSGLEDKVEVVFDDHGVPHIQASSRKDATYALGMIVARERLFQMELLRRIVNGEISELLGEKLFKTDVLLRTLQFRKTGEKIIKLHMKNWPDELVELSKAYLQGVNDFQKQGPLPIEFFALDITPRDFTLEEMVGISGYLALTFAEGLLSDPAYTYLANKLPLNQVDELFSRRDLWVGKKQVTAKLDIGAEYFQAIDHALDGIRNTVGLFHGSNSWVLAGNRTESGFPILANDPHIAYSIPPTWYEAHIITPEWESYGHYMPLVPFPGLHHNRDHGWAITMSEVDDLNLYVEKINPDNPKEVMFQGKWVPLIENKEKIFVKGKGIQEVVILESPHGPLIDQTEFGLKDTYLALKWAFHLSDNNVVQTFYELSKAKNYQDFKQALSHAAAPGFNMSWADKEGNIGWHIMGRIPILPRGVNTLGLLDGASGLQEYLGYLKSDLNPHLENPKSGIIVTANSVPDYGITQGEFLGYWQHPDRYNRIHELLASKEKWNLEDLKMVQTDEFVHHHAWRRDQLIKLVQKKANDPRVKNLLDKFSTWDGSADKNSAGGALYFVWTHYLIRELISDEMGHELYSKLGKAADYMFFLDKILVNDKSLWWDDVTTTDHVETAAEISYRALELAISHQEKVPLDIIVLVYN